MAISLAIVMVFIVPAILDDAPPLAVALVGSMAVMLTTIPLAHEHDVVLRGLCPSCAN